MKSTHKSSIFVNNISYFDVRTSFIAPLVYQFLVGTIITPIVPGGLLPNVPSNSQITLGPIII